MRREERTHPLAIIGIGCRYPGGASSPARFWKLLTEGIDAITETPPGRFDADDVSDADPSRAGRSYTRWGGFINGIDGFDADFFGISPREARRIDPQQRVLLEVAWEALEDAGQPLNELAGSRTGVFIGISTHDYGDVQFDSSARAQLDAHVATGTANCIAANRISYCLDLRGPSLAIDTACSSSLTAVHLASRSLAQGDCDLAVVGGVNALIATTPTIVFGKAGMLAPDGRCKPFDASANGYVRAEGAGAIVLKPLARALRDHDPIYAVILGSAINQDGHTTGLTVPNPAAQQALLEEALRAANVSSADVQYVEAHGTGTAVGDPREAEAIGRVYSRGRTAGQPCLIGSVKGNIGHLEAGAGIAGVIKTALALKHRVIPPSLHFERPNPAIAFDELALRVPVALQDWPAPQGNAVAGVNSFGFGGANAHVIVAEAPVRTGTPAAQVRQNDTCVLTLSGRTPQALRDLADAYRDQLAGENAPAFADVCYTASVRRIHHEYRLAVIASHRAEAVQHLDAFLRGDASRDVVAGHVDPNRQRKLAFVFAGMGPQWWGMGRQLLAEEPVFGRALEECDALLTGMAQWSLLDELRQDEKASRITDTDRAHVANFALQYALSALWRSWGVLPDAVVGHSSGEMAAACLAGTLSLPDALRLAWQRGRLQHRVTGSGGMLAAGIPFDEAQSLIRDCAAHVSVAAVNGPASVTLSGDVAALDQIAASLRAADRFCRMLPVRVPYHGPQMDPLRAEMLEAFDGLTAGAASIPLMSSVTAGWLNGEAATAEYWWRNVRQPVLFAAAIEHLANDGCTTYVELSPHPVLTQSIGECATVEARDVTVLPTLRRSEDERHALLRTLAALHVQGRAIDWSGVFAQGGTCVTLPSYPWQRERYWLESPADKEEAATRAPGSDTGHPLLGRRLHSARPTWETALADPRLEFVSGHVVGEHVALPGAAFVETALAAARELRRGTDSVVLETVEFHRLLNLADPAVTLQCVLDERTDALGLYSARRGAQEWTLHASARLATPRRSTPAPRLDSLRESCFDEVDVDGFYEVMARRHRLRLRDAFRCVRVLHRGPGEAIGRLSLTGADADSSNAYWIHPALLDGAFQVMFAAIASPDDTQYEDCTVLPVAVTRIESHARAGAEVWSHVTVDRRLDGALEGNVRVFTAAGELALECIGLRLKVIAHRERETDWLHQEVWEPAPRDALAVPLPSANDIVAAAGAPVERMAMEMGVADYYRVHEPVLNALAAHYARTALRELGCDPEADASVESATLTERLRVIPRHRRFLDRLLDIARAHVTQDGDAAANTEPRMACAFTLLRASGERLARTLRGEADAREWMFSGDMLRALHDFYADSPPFRFYNAVLADVVAASRPAGRRVRVLEVGAGTGSTTAAVLQRLDGVPFDYVFTDVSPFFLKYAREHLERRVDVRFEVLDIEQPQRSDGAFDIIIGANVVHATADVRATVANLRSLLAPDGTIVLLEAIRRSPWIEIIFGQLDAWWRFADELRSDHALLDIAEWESLLSEDGSDAASLTSVASDGGPPNQAILLARAPHSAAATRAAAPARNWLVLADRRGVATRVMHQLRPKARCTLITTGPAFRQCSDDRYELDPTQPKHWIQLLREVPSDSAGLAVLHLAALDSTLSEDLDSADVMRSVQQNVGSIAALIQAVEATATPLTEIKLVTAGAYEPQGVEQQCNATQASIWGVGRVIRHEQPALRTQMIDLGAECTPADVTALIGELLAPPRTDEDEVALRGKQRFVRGTRAVTSRALPARHKARLVPTATPFKLEYGMPGALDALTLRETAPLQPGPGEVAIRVCAAGLNFRDVLAALGLLPEHDGHAHEAVGGECTGIVAVCGAGVTNVRPGDEVVALVTSGIGSIVMARAELVVPKPAALSFDEAATLPSAFVTARYGLERFAHLSASERVLIHAAAGGVGMAAVQLARRAGAEIFATAGTPEKRAFLNDLGIAHVLDSRTLEFAEEIMRRTGGEGVDVVLNSLSGAAMLEGFNVLRRYGRFVEIGRRDILQNTMLGLQSFEKCLTLSAFDLVPLADDRTAEVGAVLRSVVEDVAHGELVPLPYTTFDMADVEHAFRFMAQARHIGKIVLTVQQPHYPVAPRDAEALFRRDATYLITGGLGGFGLAVAEWMVAGGAHHVVLMSRSGVPRSVDEAALQRLQQSGANIVVERGDVANQDDLAHVLDTVRSTMPPLRGVFHAAMVLADELLSALNDEQIAAVLAPKVAGGWNLHCLTRTDPLDVFVLFSSGVAVVGVPKQANYAAANAFLDSLAVYRRQLDLPALSINWGAIEDVGFVARHPEVVRHLARRGVGSVTSQEACAALDTVLRHDVNRIAIGRIDWSRWHSYRPGVDGRAGSGASVAGMSLRERLARTPASRRAALVTGELVRRAAHVLGAAPERLDVDRALTDMGLDSLMAVEYRTAMRVELGIEIELLELLEGTTLRNLARIALVQLVTDTADVA